ncbi:hypothetical protein STEG23_029947 [Scotinomys teguina]
MTHFRRRRGSLEDYVPRCSCGGRRVGGADAEPDPVQGGRRAPPPGASQPSCPVAFPGVFDCHPARLPDYMVQVAPFMTFEARVRNNSVCN